MAKSRISALRLWTCLVAPLAVMACNSPPKSCPAIGGTYQPLYTVRSGTCGPLTNANNIKVENNILIEKFANVDVETETIVMGCWLNMTQIVRDKMGAPQQRIDGSSLDVQSADLLSGMVTLTRYDAAGGVSCYGEYDAQLMKPTTTIGGAAVGAGAAQ